MHEVEKIIDGKAQEFIDISDTIWDYSEVGFKEYASSELVRSYLKKNGFTIESVRDLDTAFIAEFKTDARDPIVSIGFIGEYDAVEGQFDVPLCELQTKEKTRTGFIETLRGAVRGL